MWGLGEGIEFDVTEPPKRLDSVMIQSGDIIDAFGFSYTDEAGQKHTVGPYGGSGGSLTTVSKNFESSESYLTLWSEALINLQANLFPCRSSLNHQSM